MGASLSKVLTQHKETAGAFWLACIPGLQGTTQGFLELHHNYDICNHRDAIEITSWLKGSMWVMNGCDLPVAVLGFHAGLHSPSCSATSGFHLLQESQIISMKTRENIKL